MFCDGVSVLSSVLSCRSQSQVPCAPSKELMQVTRHQSPGNGLYFSCENVPVAHTSLGNTVPTLGCGVQNLWKMTGLSKARLVVEVELILSLMSCLSGGLLCFHLRNLKGHFGILVVGLNIKYLRHGLTTLSSNRVRRNIHINFSAPPLSESTVNFAAHLHLAPEVFRKELNVQNHTCYVAFGFQHDRSV